MNTEAILKVVINSHEKVIISVLRDLLKREPTIDDFKLTTIFRQQGSFDTEYLAYNNLKIGIIKIKHNYSEGKSWIEFIPFETKDFLEQAIVGSKVTF